MLISLFSAGETTVTPRASESLLRNNRHQIEFILHHISGKWGNVTDEEKNRNDKAVDNGGRILSRYQLEDSTIIVVITEAENSQGQRIETAIILLDELGEE